MELVKLPSPLRREYCEGYHEQGGVLRKYQNHKINLDQLSFVTDKTNMKEYFEKKSLRRLSAPGRGLTQWCYESSSYSVQFTIRSLNNCWAKLIEYI